MGLCRLRDILSPPASHNDAAGGPFFFATTKNRSGHEKPLSRRSEVAGHSSLQLRKLESDAEGRCRDGRSRRNHTVIPKSEPKIKNHCSDEAVSGQSLAAIPKLTPSNQESMHERGLKQGKPCIDSQVWARNQESMHASGRKPGKPCIDSQVWA